MSRVSQGQMVAGAGGIILFVALFFHWGGGQNAWDLFSFVEVWLIIVAVAATVYGLGAVFGLDLGLPPQAGLLAAGLGMAVLGWSFGFETEVSGSLGVWIAIVGALAIVFGGYDASRTPVAARAPRAAAPPPPPPTTTAGPPPTASGPPPTTAGPPSTP